MVEPSGPDVAPVRSLLFTPANREQRMHRALTVGADAVVFDLESAIPRGEAALARGLVAELVTGHHAGRATTRAPNGRGQGDGPVPSLFVRVSPVGSDEQPADLAAAVRPGLDVVMLPQVLGPADVVELDRRLAAAERDADMPVGSVRVMPLVENAHAVRLAYEIAVASARVAYMGGATSRGGDLARSLGFRFTATGSETLFLRSKILVDVRSAGVPNPLSGLWGALDDDEGLRSFAIATRDLGYEGMMVIHPAHLDVVHDVFTPSRAEIAGWRRIVEAVADAERQGLGAVRLDGRLVDVAHAHTARHELERARRLGVDVGEEG